jgi:hypothetical protein
VAVADSARSSVKKGRFIGSASDVQTPRISPDFYEDIESSVLRWAPRQAGYSPDEAPCISHRTDFGK